MNYKIDDVDIVTFNAYPCVDYTKECIALSGVFDLPKRKGITEYSWGSSIEPFVEKEDIEFDGRTLTLTLCVSSSNLDNFLDSCIACRKLSTEFGVFDVIVKDEIKVDEIIGLDFVKVTVKFWQQSYSIPELILNSSGKGSYLLDSYNLSKDFDIYISSVADRKGIPKRIDVNTNLPYTGTKYRESRDLTLNCYMKGENLSELYAKMMQLHALCIRPGLHALQLPENGYYSLYFKDGISVKATDKTLLKFDLKCRAVEPWLKSSE